MVELTDEQKQDVENRKKEFMEKYIALTEELQMDFSQYPIPVPIGNGVWGTMINAELQDKKYLVVPSPFTHE